MVRPDQEAIDTFMSITGVSEASSIQKLEEHLGNLNEAVNAHFNDGGRNIAQDATLTHPQPQDDIMDIDDPMPVESHRPRSSRPPSTRDLNHFSLLEPNITTSILDGGTNSSSAAFASHPRDVMQIPIEVKDGTGASGQSGSSLTIEDVTERALDHGPEIRETTIIDSDDGENDAPNARIAEFDGLGNRSSSVPSAPTIIDVPDYNNDIEEEMIRAAIEASKQDVTMSNQQYDHLDLGDPTPQPVSSHDSHLEDSELARAVSLSLQTAEREKALRDLEGNAVGSESEAQKSSSPDEMGKLTSSYGRQPQLEIGSTSIQEETEDVEELQLVRHRRRRVTSSSTDTPNDVEGVDVNPPSSPQPNDNVRHSQQSGSDFPSDEWGGISSVEHDEAVMLEAAMFGGIPEGSGYPLPYVPHQLMQNGLDRGVGPHPRREPRPPSPSLTAQRLIRVQQDDEYLASLQADREKELEKELKAKEEAEAAFAEQRRKEDELRIKLQEEQEIERQLTAKEASLPQEPTPNDEDAITLLVRMPDGNRRGRRFRKSDKLQYLFDFIDVGRGVKPGSYRLVRPYPRRAFSDGESSSTLNELGLTSKQEALFLEMI